jgi:hypothetical protein
MACNVCGKPCKGVCGSGVCGGCRLVAYCSHECQKRDRALHKTVCPGESPLPHDVPASNHLRSLLRSCALQLALGRCSLRSVRCSLRSVRCSLRSGVHADTHTVPITRACPLCKERNEDHATPGKPSGLCPNCGVLICSVCNRARVKAGASACFACGVVCDTTHVSTLEKRVCYDEEWRLRGLGAYVLSVGFDGVDAAKSDIYLRLSAQLKHLPAELTLWEHGHAPTDEEATIRRAMATDAASTLRVACILICAVPSHLRGVEVMTAAAHAGNPMARFLVAVELAGGVMSATDCAAAIVLLEHLVQVNAIVLRDGLQLM